MRTFPTSITNKITATQDIEPITLLRIFWNHSTTGSLTYSDRKFEQFGFIGRLLAIGQIDDVVDLSSSTKSGEVTVTLDDSDKSIKEVFNHSDIHKTKAQILLWFSDLSKDDAVVIFDGEINSPIEWKESDLTLTFNIVTPIENFEVGVSIEDTAFGLQPDSLVGQAWPIVFGTVAGIKPLRVIDVPSGFIAEGFGVINEDVWTAELVPIQEAFALARDNSELAFEAAIGTALTGLKYTGSDYLGINADTDKVQQYQDAANSLFAQAAQYQLDASEIGRQLAFKLEQRAEQRAFARSAVGVISQNLPQGTPFTFKLNDVNITATRSGNTLSIHSKTYATDLNKAARFNLFIAEGSTLTQTSANRVSTTGGQKFFWVAAGTEFRVTNFPITFIASLGHVSIFNVYGTRSGVRLRLTPDLYTVSFATYPNANYPSKPLKVTYITLPVPLTSRYGTDENQKTTPLFDSDDIEFDASSTDPGSNPVDIMSWVLNNFTNLTQDATSFAAVRAKLTNFPMNFALITKINALEFIKQLAYFSRSAAWVDDGKVYLRYLADKPTPIDTIVSADIAIETLSIGTVDTEELITKYIAVWKARTNQQKPNKIIYAYNRTKYGVKSQTFDYYCYNTPGLVQQSAKFWMIRTSNTFKLLRFKASGLHKLKLEVFDPVLVDLEPDLICETPVIGILTKAAYNSDDFTIDMEVWVPVRTGEMVEYQFAYPGNMDETVVYPVEFDPNLRGFNPFEGVLGDLPRNNLHVRDFNLTHGKTPTDGDYEPLNDDVNQAYLDQIYEDLHRPDGTLDDQVAAGNSPTRLSGSNDYDKYQVKTVNNPSFVDPTNATFPGVIQSNIGGDQYDVAVYFKGTNNATTRITVKQLKIRENDIIPNNTWVQVTRNVWRIADDPAVQIEYTMQTPIWLPKLL